LFHEYAVETPTILALRMGRQARAAYVFRLDEWQLAAAREAGLPDSALLALAAISSAAYGPRRDEWVSLTHRVMEAFGKGYRWWYRATSLLEQRGFIQCRRGPGRLPRYRLLKQPDAASYRLKQLDEPVSLNERAFDGQ
jgi:hypothetical protein